MFPDLLTFCVRTATGRTKDYEKYPDWNVACDTKFKFYLSEIETARSPAPSVVEKKRTKFLTYGSYELEGYDFLCKDGDRLNRKFDLRFARHGV
mgnify:CR=1 FL=1